MRYFGPWFYEQAICPFCKEEDFDLVGLKHHFDMGYCDKFKTIQAEYEKYCDEKDAAVMLPTPSPSSTSEEKK
jgi:hypothetical protein